MAAADVYASEVQALRSQLLKAEGARHKAEKIADKSQKDLRDLLLSRIPPWKREALEPTAAEENDADTNEEPMDDANDEDASLPHAP